MTLPIYPSSISMAQINNEFGRGYNLNSYRGVRWYTDSGSSGFFSSGQIGMNDFYGKRVDAPITYVYRREVFTSSSFFTLPSNFLQAQGLLIVAGGGGTSWVPSSFLEGSGGGGAGGVIWKTQSDLTSMSPGGTLSCTIGSGGSGVPIYGDYSKYPTNGGNTVCSYGSVFSYTAIGGGFGAFYGIDPAGEYYGIFRGGTGGSGGGGCAYYGQDWKGQGTPGQGYAGAIGAEDSTGGGGGGYTETPPNGRGKYQGTPYEASRGGNGLNFRPDSNYFSWPAGGGGGSAGNIPTSPGTGGIGGGGTGGRVANGQPGSANTGGGAGGSWGAGGANGGSGVVVLFYVTNG